MSDNKSASSNSSQEDVDDVNVEQRSEMLRNEGNHCFVCGPSNPIGLQIRFRMERDAGEQVCRAEFTAEAKHMGYDNVTHGGIVFSILDDVMANWIWLQGQQCFTGKAEIRYRAELPVGVPVRLEGRCLKRKGRFAQMQGKVIRVEDDFVVAEATAAFMLAADNK